MGIRNQRKIKIQRARKPERIKARRYRVFRSNNLVKYGLGKIKVE